jgi:hypothetical protein
MIELTDGLFVNPKLIAVVKSLGDDQCAIFTPGQSATDGGFLVNRSGLEVAETIDYEAEEED